jgi:hypothetical protein
MQSFRNVDYSTLTDIMPERPLVMCIYFLSEWAKCKNNQSNYKVQQEYYAQVLKSVITVIGMEIQCPFQAIREFGFGKWNKILQKAIRICN